MMNKHRRMPSDKEKGVAVFTELTNAINVLTKNNKSFYIDMAGMKPLTKLDKKIVSSAKLIHQLITVSKMYDKEIPFIDNLICGAYSGSLNRIQLEMGGPLVHYLAYPAGIIWLDKVDTKLLQTPSEVLLNELFEAVANIKQLNHILVSCCRNIVSSRKLG